MLSRGGAVECRQPVAGFVGGQEQQQVVCLDHFVHILLCGLAMDKGC